MTRKIDFKFEKLEDSLGYLLWQTTMSWQRQMNQALEKVALTHTQFVILAALGWLLRHTDAVTQKEIAEHSNTDRMMVSKILRTLENKGLLDRKEHPVDSRAKLVTLTKQGLETLQRALQVKSDANNLYFKNLSDKEAFRQELVNLMEPN